VLMVRVRCTLSSGMATGTLEHFCQLIYFRSGHTMALYHQATNLEILYQMVKFPTFVWLSLRSSRTFESFLLTCKMVSTPITELSTHQLCQLLLVTSFTSNSQIPSRHLWSPSADHLMSVFLHALPKSIAVLKLVRLLQHLLRSFATHQQIHPKTSIFSISKECKMLSLS
jgi:hypothetical protein